MKTQKLLFGTGGTLGVISLLGACGGACTAAALPTPCEPQAGRQQAGIRATEGDLALFFDPRMGSCEKACGYHGTMDEKKLGKQPGAKVGDLVRCPVSGVVFEVKPETAKVTFNGKQFFTCCPTCAANFEQKKKILGKT